MELRILTPERRIPDLTVERVTLPAFDGEIGVLPRRAPLVTLLGEGRMSAVLPGGSTSTYALRGGVAQVVRDQITVLAEAVVPIDDLSEASLIERLRKLDEATYEDPIALTQAKAQAHWITTQLKAAGYTVPELKQLG
jgi:F-type H+-transporting ATPase subunit epsilon